jgi:hypothetical protein
MFKARSSHGAGWRRAQRLAGKDDGIRKPALGFGPELPTSNSDPSALTK